MSSIKLFILSVASLMLMACASTEPNVSTENSASYSCYKDFRNIGQNRLVQNEQHTAKLLEIIEGIQSKRNVDFNAAFVIFKSFKGNEETAEIDNQIAEIDSKSVELNELVKPNSGEESCIERLRLEDDRAKLAKMKFEAIGQALLND